MSQQPPPYGGWQKPGEPSVPPPSVPPPSGLTTPPQPAAGWGAPTAGPAYGHDPQWRPPPKPGVVPLRPLGLGELLDGAVQTIRTNPRVMLGLSLAVLAAAGVLSTVLIVAGLPRLMSVVDRPGSTVGSADLANLAGGGVVAVLVPALLQGLSVVVLSGVLIMAVSEAVLGRKPSVRQVWAVVRRRLLPLIGLSLLTALIAILSIAVLVGPGLGLLAVSGTAAAVALVIGVPAAVAVTTLISVRLAFAAPALLLENLGVLASLRRSWRLVKGSWWRVLGVLLLSTIIAAIANGILQAPWAVISTVVAAAVAPDSATSTGASSITTGLVITTVIGNIGRVIASAVTAPFSAAVTALLYIDLRIRREGLDVALARAAEA